jgi:hypothetical protein
MSKQKISKDLPSVTSSQVSEGGAEHLSLQDGNQTDLFGQGHPHVSRLAQQEVGRENRTPNDIYGRSSSISLRGADLQQSLGSKLAQLSDMDGSTIYRLTLKQKTTPQQRSYFHLAASVRRTNENASSSWPTPVAADVRDRGKFDDPSVQRRIKIKKTIELSMLVASVAPYRHAKKSPKAQEIAVSGTTLQSSTVETASNVPYQLNPRFSLWLMGYPIAWAYCGERATQSSRKQRQK